MPEFERGGLSAWAARIRESDMPIFGATAALIDAVAHSDRASAGALAQVILQDAAMTAKVLKLANSAYFNPSRRSISTISRAIVVLGFELVRTMALSLSLIDALLQGGVRQRVEQEMARSFHAAVQARAVAVKRRDASPEEVFIAALLFRIGEMAFWCAADDAGTHLDRLLRQPDVDPDEAEQSVLGFRLRQLSACLAREWRLNPILLSVAEGSVPPGGRETVVTLSHALARAVESGWESPQARAALQDYAEFVGEPVPALFGEIACNATEAARIANFFGATAAARQIPLPPAAEALQELLLPVEAAKPDPQLQLKILRDISFLIADRPKLGDLLEMILEGIFRGIGMDRTLFALVNPERTQLVGKAALGKDAENLCHRFVFPLGVPHDAVTETILQRRIYWPGGSARPLPARETTRLRTVTGGSDFMLAPIVVNGRAIGLFYADRTPSGASLVEDDFLGFQHFVQQAGLGFRHAATQPCRAIV